MRVLFIEMTLGFGGSGKSLIELIGSLPEIDAHILAEFDIGAHVKRALPTVHCEHVVIERRHGQGRLAGYRFTAGRMVTWTSRIVRAIRTHRPDLVHANNGVAQNLPALLAARITGTPIVVHQRGWEDERRMLSMGRRVARVVPVIAISDAIRAHMIALRFTPDQVRRIHDVVLGPAAAPVEAPGRTDARVRIGMHSVLTPWKGQHVLLEAVARLHARRPGRIAVEIAGDDLDPSGAYLRSLRERVTSLGLDRVVSFPGHRDDVYAWLRTLDISVHASVTAEPLGRVIVEAQLAGVPVVATRGGGADELVASGVSGILVRPDDPAAMAEALERLVDDAALRASLGRGGQADASRRFDTASLAAEVRALYRDVIGR